MKEYVYKFAENDLELAGVREVRKQVFVDEQGISEDLVFSGEESNDGIVVVVLDSGVVVGTARVVFPADDTAKIERMAVLKPFRSQGIGKKMVSYIIDYLKSHRVANVFLHAQYTAVSFYKSCGFRESGPFFIEAGIKHIKMDL